MSEEAERAVLLPIQEKMTINKVIYTNNARDGLSGDGLFCLVALIKESEMKDFARKLPNDKSWHSGPINEYGLFMECISFIERGIEIHIKDIPKFREAINISNIVKEKHLYFKIEYQRNRNNFLANVKIWLIFPESNKIAIISEDT